MLGEAAFSDLLLVGGEGEGVQVHRAVLAAASPLLRRLLLDAPHPDTSLCLVGVGREELEALVMFVYWGEVEVARGRLEALLEMAEGLQIRGLCRQEGGQAEVEEGQKEQQKEQKEEEVVVHHLLVEGGEVTRKELEHVAAPVPWCQFLKSERIKEEVEETKEKAGIETTPLKDTVADAMGDVPLLETDHAPAGLDAAPCSVQDGRGSRRGGRVKVEAVEASPTDTTTCATCGKVFTTRFGLREHAMAVHEGVRYLCDHCDHVASSKRNLRGHMGRRHAGTPLPAQYTTKTLHTVPTEAAVKPKKPKMNLTSRKEGIRKLFFKKSGKGAEGWGREDDDISVEEAERGAPDLEMKVENGESRTDEAKLQEVGLGVEEKDEDELKDLNDNKRKEEPLGKNT